ncbi:helix-turn-helix transcriptional regulator [Myroides odoratimimus]|uniref:helix-turn-helix domain-containing protein n=1 Tax=Myroides odoratimimus TaxID=76832 RepID=UPI0025764B02|nr:helix-turn-helix transcriptional regulator [Myroides odoratimimus]MDM1397195.1 helix-turn-helix transcriptional regulator [Myroides odoratimimus]
MELGKAIREVRKKKGFTLVEMSDKTGISINALSLMEKGDTFPQKKSLEKVSEALNVPINYFLLLAVDQNDIEEDKRDIFNTLHNTLKEIVLKDILK